LNLDLIIYIYAPITIFAPCYTYYMAVYVEKSAKPFPHSTITQTANKYPQNIVFRLICGIGSSIIVLLFNTIYRWIEIQASRSKFRKMSSVYYYLMLIGLIGFCIATQTIDGLSNGPLHTPSALIFFICLETFIVYTTLYLHELHSWDTNIISSRSLLIKQGLCVYVTGVWLYCLYNTFGIEDNSIDYTVVLEWNAFFISFFWIFSYFEEWKQLKIALIGP
jgi:hypothetical protein